MYFILLLEKCILLSHSFTSLVDEMFKKSYCFSFLFMPQAIANTTFFCILPASHSVEVAVCAQLKISCAANSAMVEFAAKNSVNSDAAKNSKIKISLASAIQNLEFKIQNFRCTHTHTHTHPHT
jgi:hypothetical protein